MPQPRLPSHLQRQAGRERKTEAVVNKKLDWLRRHKWFIAVAVALVMLAPLPAAAATNSEVIAILNASITGFLSLIKLAYCAAGVTQLC